MTLQPLTHESEIAPLRLLPDSSAGDRWPDSTVGTSVRAVLVDPKSGAVRARALARAIATASGPATAFVREEDGCLYFATNARRSDADLDARIRQLAVRFDVRVVAIGGSVRDSSDADFATIAEQARRAADIVAAVPELGMVGWYAELGPWVMLSRIAPGSLRMRDISPAAEVLLAPGNEIYRETVEAYLDAAGRNGEACERLHIHRTTLYYRLDKAPYLVREALRDGAARSSMHLALKLQKLWGSAGAARA